MIYTNRIEDNIR